MTPVTEPATTPAAPTPNPTTTSGEIPALFSEIGTDWVAGGLGEIAVEALTERGTSGIIDLRAMPITPGDYGVLEEVLAEGEVKATIDAAGLTEVRETLYPGVWWIRHRNEAGEVVGEFIEVTASPEILKSPMDDVQEGLADLAALLEQAESGGVE